jgi:hypothetical protein
MFENQIFVAKIPTQPKQLGEKSHPPLQNCFENVGYELLGYVKC